MAWSLAAALKQRSLETLLTHAPNMFVKRPYFPGLVVQLYLQTRDEALDAGLAQSESGISIGYWMTRLPWGKRNLSSKLSALIG